MNFKRFFDDEDAVSPVIGVILMVAITVILAAVIGTFVLGLGGQVQQTAPNAQWNWDQPTTTALELTHEGGQGIDPARLEVSRADGNAVDSTCNSASAWGGNSKVTAGATCDVMSGTAVGSTTYRLVWSAESGDTSSVLTSYDSS